MEIDEKVIRKNIRVILVDLQKSAKASGEAEKRWKVIERWLLFGNLVVSSLQLVATLIKYLKKH